MNAIRHFGIYNRYWHLYHPGKRFFANVIVLSLIIPLMLVWSFSGWVVVFIATTMIGETLILTRWAPPPSEFVTQELARTAKRDRHQRRP